MRFRPAPTAHPQLHLDYLNDAEEGAAGAGLKWVPSTHTLLHGANVLRGESEELAASSNEVCSWH